MKSLSQQLADLSVRAKAAEDRVAAVQGETRERLASSRKQAETDLHHALGRVEQRYNEAKNDVQGHFAAFKTKVSSDIQSLKDRVARANDEHKASHAERHAEDMAYEAALAIEYAVSAVSMAELAALDAIAAREEAATAKAATMTA